jgi:VanZ family protein
MTLVNYLIDRLKEPSTYTGLGTLLAAFGLHFSDTQVSAIVSLSLAIGGLLSVFLPEGKSQ